MQSIILFLTATLSVLLPEGVDINEEIIRRKEVTLPYGVLPLYNEENGITLSLYSIIDTVKYIQFSPIVQYQKNRWGFTVAPLVRKGDAHIYPTREEFGAYADILRGSIFYRTNNLILSFGKDIFLIGSSFEHNPLLSPNIPLNYARFIYTNDKFSFTHFLARLDDYTGREKIWAGGSTADTATFQRYLGIHRLEFKPRKWFAISFSEVMLIGGEYSGFPFELLSPVTIYYIEQFNQKKNVNILWNIDSKAVWKDFLFYFDLFIDDFQLEADPWNEPNHMGIYFGIQRIDLFKEGSLLLLSYNIMSRWSYSNLIVWQRYIDKDFSLGTPLGNDYDRFYMQALYPISSFKTGFEFSFTRKGENSINNPWPVNTDSIATPENQFNNTNFLSGTIEKRLSISSILKYRDLLTLKAGLYHIQNYQHQEGTTKTEPLLELKIKYHI
ncbi:hypothetical protein KAT89_06230 [candidate division WOR-3 bacterium]|nr:hypothetical protein [candidate division WOR-3 bacterium]